VLDLSTRHDRQELRRPPEPFKDSTEAAQTGVNLRRWWSDCLGAIGTPPRRIRDAQATGYGPAIATHRPTAADFSSKFDRHERAAIYEFDAGITREAVERLAGLSRPATEASRSSSEQGIELICWLRYVVTED
jgi:hypothetical protein